MANDCRRAGSGSHRDFQLDIFWSSSWILFLSSLDGLFFKRGLEFPLGGRLVALLRQRHAVVVVERRLVGVLHHQVLKMRMASSLRFFLI